MRTKLLIADQIYVISNFLVARNAIFNNKPYCKRFLQKLDRYLSPICTIYQYRINVDQFHLIIKLNSREVFENYYRNKMSNPDIESSKIPHESYIFSQAMANLQSSTAIHFNRKERRKGAVFARRFQRHLVKSQNELKSWLHKFRNLSIESIQSKFWRNNKGGEGCRSSLGERLDYLKNGSLFYKKGNSGHPILTSFRRCIEDKLQGQFKKKRFLRLHILKTQNSPP